MAEQRHSVAVFVPRLHLRGGGEKHGVGIAAALSTDHDVTIYALRDVDLQETGRYLGLDLSRCSFRRLPGPSLLERAAWRLNAPWGLPAKIAQLSVYRWLAGRGHTYVVNADHRSTMPCPSEDGLYLCMFPRRYAATKVRRWQRMLASIGVDTGLASPLSYSTIAANSDFTARWIERYWGTTPSAVLYPPCFDMLDGHVEKRRLILNVGRFFPRGGDENDKRQDVLLDAFARLTDLHAQGWELHLAGSVSSAAHHLAALEELRAQAVGLPVVFHPNVGFDDLRRLYNEAALYWHATGFDTDEEAAPARQEHFGITPVEAMSARAVPLVYATAGPKSTVIDGVSGYHWRTLDDLRRQTRALAADPGLRMTMADGARLGSEQYGWASFSAHALDIANRER